MDIEDFLAERVGSDYGVIRKEREYKKCTQTLSFLYRLIEDKLNVEGEHIIEKIKILNDMLNGISNLFLYKKGLKDGIRLGELLAEAQTKKEIS